MSDELLTMIIGGGLIGGVLLVACLILVLIFISWK